MNVREQQHHPHTDAVCLDDVSFRYGSESRKSEVGSRKAGDGDTAGASALQPSDFSLQPSTQGFALRHVTLHVERGVSLGIIGPNGGGKTTLIKLVLGLLEPTAGTVRVMGMTPRQATRAGGLIGYVPQRPGVAWRFPVTARQVVHMGLVGVTGVLRRASREQRAYAEHLIEVVGARAFADHPIGDLSGGQQQRVFIARALSARPKVLLMDEPMVGIDQAGQQRFAELLRNLHRELGLTLVLVSHDLRAIAAGCDRVACLNQTIHYHDAPQGLTSEVLNEVFQHEVGVRG